MKRSRLKLDTVVFHKDGRIGRVAAIIRRPGQKLRYLISGHRDVFEATGSQLEILRNPPNKNTSLGSKSGPEEALNPRVAAPLKSGSSA